MAKELFVYSPYKSKFEEQVSSGAVDDSQIGIIAETGELWVKGTYLPIVDLSNKADISKGVIEADGLKDSTDTTFFTPNRGLDPNTTLATQKYVAEATTNFANDLTGVIEATAEEFTYRPSAGNKSIRDASAVIRRIKGNTVVFAQLADFSDVLRREGDWSVAVEVTANTWGGFSKPIQVIAGHKYLFYINKKDGRSITDTYTLLKDTHRVDFNTPLFIESKETASWRWTARYQTSTNGLRFQPQAFDLTRLFGAGNEPTTIEEFKSSFPDSYYPYSEPEVRNVKTIAIHTVGFNQWDERWELGGLNYETGQTTDDNTKGRSVNYFDVLPSTAYYCHTIANTTTNASGVKGAVNIVWYDSNKSFIKYQVFTNTILKSPSNARYAKIYTYAGDVNAIFRAGICINLSHSGVRNGEYEPYVKHVRQLPEIIKNFPDGMNGNANVWDEINAESWIKRWGVVDLGSIDDYTYTGSAFRSSFLKSKMSSVATLGDYNENMICELYDNDRWSNSPYKIQFTVNNGYLWINNPDYTDIDSFKAAMSGVLLYYELLEPIETPITEAIQLDYEVDDFGTEKAFAFGNSAPFRADIVYQFNAEGRIRDNSRNIERVEGDIDNLTPTFQASLGLPYRLMAWDGSQTMLSLPIAKSITDWEMEEPPYAAIPTGKQVMDYINIIKGSLATGLMPKETLTIGANGLEIIDPNKVYEITTASSTTYNVGLYLSTTSGVDVVADNEWRIRIDTRNGFSGRINIEPSGSGYTTRWAYPEASGVGTAPTITAGYIWDIQFRMVGKTLLGSYKKY